MVAMVRVRKEQKPESSKKDMGRTTFFLFVFEYLQWFMFGFKAVTSQVKLVLG